MDMQTRNRKLTKQTNKVLIRSLICIFVFPTKDFLMTWLTTHSVDSIGR